MPDRHPPFLVALAACSSAYRGRSLSVPEDAALPLIRAAIVAAYESGERNSLELIEAGMEVVDQITLQCSNQSDYAPPLSSTASGSQDKTSA